MVQAAPLVHDVGIDAVRERHAGHRGVGLGALGQDLLFELGAMASTGLVIALFDDPFGRQASAFRPGKDRPAPVSQGSALANLASPSAFATPVPWTSRPTFLVCW